MPLPLELRWLSISVEILVFKACGLSGIRLSAGPLTNRS